MSQHLYAAVRDSGLTLYRARWVRAGLLLLPPVALGLCVCCCVLRACWGQLLLPNCGDNRRSRCHVHLCNRIDRIKIKVCDVHSMVDHLVTNTLSQHGGCLHCSHTLAHHSSMTCGSQPSGNNFIAFSTALRAQQAVTLPAMHLGATGVCAHPALQHYIRCWANDVPSLVTQVAG